MAGRGRGRPDDGCVGMEPGADLLASDVSVALGLQSLVSVWWQLRDPGAAWLVQALRQSQGARCATLKRHLALVDVPLPTALGARHLDFDHLFTHICTPPFCMELIEARVTEGWLTRPEASK